MEDGSDPCAEGYGKTWTCRSWWSAWLKATRPTWQRRGRASSDAEAGFVAGRMFVQSNCLYAVRVGRRDDQGGEDSDPVAIDGAEELAISNRPSRSAGPCEGYGEKLRECRLGSSWQRCCRAQTAGHWESAGHVAARLFWCARGQDPQGWSWSEPGLSESSA